MLGHLLERDPQRVRPLAAYLRERTGGPRARARSPDLVLELRRRAGARDPRAPARRSWQEIIETQILDRLGLSYTTAREPYPPRDDLPAAMPGPLAEHLSNGYRWTGEAHARREFEYITHIAPAGAISSSAGDRARYMRMLSGHSRLRAHPAVRAADQPDVFRAVDLTGLPFGGVLFRRRLRFTLATMTFLALGSVLALWGAPRPW